jgi:hypothetical protein
MQPLQQQQQSFNLMLTCPRDKFTGRLTCAYDRPYRLHGCWEVKLISFSRAHVPLFILCDVVEYCEVKRNRVQLLD